MKGYTIYDLHENRHTHSFGGHETVVDGEHGRDTFPGTWWHEDARDHYRAGLPWNEPLPDAHTYTIALDNHYYAFATDTLLTTVYAIGPDRKPDAINAQCFTGSTAERNDAIRAVCAPHTWKEAYLIAKAHGNYVGQLYAN